ncbi:restriction endonuclease subunit M [Bacillus sp. M6-12]|uniref:type I restriction-modification system subunit M n=1 Tax=Bacillus sp. M6-12 TaxID=2054166 RepID=UPI000C75EF81|nr:class I SAM-dependent DNA methyltransferase [Bacillus sp. M6-12]PLS18951.1 restriction endonuclease subunit M [Bacillus sp. M6-12]
MTINFNDKINLIMNIADLLRGVYNPEQYKEVILPLVILKRFDSVLEEYKEAMLEEYEDMKDIPDVKEQLAEVFQLKFSNVSKYDFNRLEQEPEHIDANLLNYIQGYSDNVRDIIKSFEFEKAIAKLHKNNLLYELIKEMNKIDFHPNIVSNREMGYIFEELIRKFLENALAGDHYTPRDIVRLMTDLVLLGDEEKLKEPGRLISVYDPTCGTNGINSVVEERIREVNPVANVTPFGQEINEQSYAIGKADLLIKGGEAENIKLGNTLTEDRFPDKKFSYIMANPPYGISWKKEQKTVEDEHKTKGDKGRFGAGTPRVSDGSLLFVQHMISKMEKEEGSKVAVVLNGSPLFSGDAGSGESNIRKWIIENDLLESIVALPDSTFFNTSISTYIWILNNKKEEKRKGKVQLINAVDVYEKLPKSLGQKRKEITEAQIKQLTKIYQAFEESDICKIFNNEDFLFKKLEVRRKSDKKWKDTEQIQYKEDIQAYMEREVLPHIEDAYVVEDKIVVGAEINFTRYFYQYTPLRPSDVIKEEILEIEKEVQQILKDLLY